MHEGKWEEIKEKILKSFEILDKREERDGERLEDLEIIEFKGPTGKMKVEWITRPKVLDQKTQYSQRIGSSVSVQIEYSEDEVTHTFKVYKWSDTDYDWEEINANAFK